MRLFSTHCRIGTLWVRRSTAARNCASKGPDGFRISQPITSCAHLLPPKLGKPGARPRFRMMRNKTDQTLCGKCLNPVAVNVHCQKYKPRVQAASCQAAWRHAPGECLAHTSCRLCQATSHDQTAKSMEAASLLCAKTVAVLSGRHT